MKKEDALKNIMALSEERTARTDQTLRLMAELPGIFLAFGANVDDAVEECLTRVGLLFAATRAFVMQDEKDGAYLRNTHEWVNQDADSALFSWPLYDYEHDIPSLKPMLEEKSVFFGHSQDMPEDLRRVLDKQNVRSFILSPIFRDGQKIGLVGMAFCERECDFCEDLSFVTHCLAGLVSIALDRKLYHAMRGKLNTIKACVDDLGPLLASEAGADDAPAGRQRKPTTLVDSEKRLIIETLELYNGNKLKTAKHLGLTWPSLDRRCKKLGIEVRRR